MFIKGSPNAMRTLPYSGGFQSVPFPGLLTAWPMDAKTHWPRESQR